MVGNAGTRLLLIIGNQATFISEYMFEDSDSNWSPNGRIFIAFWHVACGSLMRKS